MENNLKTTSIEILGERWNIEFGLNKKPRAYSVHLYKEGFDYPPQISFYRAGIKYPATLNFNREFGPRSSKYGLSPREAKRIILRVLTNDPEETS